MMNKYPLLTSPIKIGHTLLKSRLLATRALPHFLQGGETHPTDSVINYYANIAKNGAAIVTVSGGFELQDRRNMPVNDMQHAPMYDPSEPAGQNYFSQLAEAIHFYGSLASVSIQRMDPPGYNISDFAPEDAAAFQGEYFIPVGRALTKPVMEEMIDNVVHTAKLYQSFGFDMVCLYMPYRSSILACCLSPAINKRTDEYGGCLENRARLPLELCRAIKDACGEDFLIEIQMSGEEEEGGYTAEDTVAFAKLAEGLVDMIQIRGMDGNATHPVGFNCPKGEHVTLHVAQKLKESGVNILIAPNGGFQNPDECESYLRNNMCDLFGMARSFICDYNYYQKILDGNTDDIVPCIRCNKCHVTSLTGPWRSVCSVNPMQGLQNRKSVLVEPASCVRKVAVIGGGPAGMMAAVTCARRGHKVTLYEKNEYLGGQLIHADYADFKWPLRDFKNYLANQMEKLGVEVRLSCHATPEIIQDARYDAVIAATGAVPKRPKIVGADSPGIWTPIDVFGNTDKLGNHVIVVGGAETGTETGMYLAANGKNVIVLTRQNKLAHDATPIHYYEIMQEAWEKLTTFQYITEANTVAVTPNSVTYLSKDGVSHTLPTDSVVISGGVTPLLDDALKFAHCATRFYCIGDCKKPKDVQNAVRTAYAAAVQI